MALMWVLFGLVVLWTGCSQSALLRSAVWAMDPSGRNYAEGAESDKDSCERDARAQKDDGLYTYAACLIRKGHLTKVPVPLTEPGQTIAPILVKATAVKTIAETAADLKACDQVTSKRLLDGTTKGILALTVGFFATVPIDIKETFKIERVYNECLAPLGYTTKLWEPEMRR